MVEMVHIKIRKLRSLGANALFQAILLLGISPMEILFGGTLLTKVKDYLFFTRPQIN